MQNIPTPRDVHEDHSSGGSAGPWDVYEAIDQGPSNEFYDARHPRVQQKGREILKAALEKSAKTDQSLDKLWEVFRDYIRAHEYSEAIAGEITRLRAELATAVRDEYLADIRAEALARVSKEIRLEVQTELRAKFERELRSTVEKELTKQIHDELKPGIIHNLAIDLRAKLAPKIREEIREQLLAEPELRKEVVSQLKKRIMGLPE
jgi:hypothetical protein